MCPKVVDEMEKVNTLIRLPHYEQSDPGLHYSLRSKFSINTAIFINCENKIRIIINNLIIIGFCSNFKGLFNKDAQNLNYIYICTKH